jgi:hypothetical protein
MKACVEWFDSISYAGAGREGLIRCISAFETRGKEAAVAEYRRVIGDHPNFASALTDLNTDKMSPKESELYFNRVMSVMFGMTLIMNGDVR